MSKQTNNEIDVLLRRLARSESSFVPAPHGDHLDPDELSAYAQNALPAAARLRYTAHVADCAVCRKLAVELTLSLGASTATAREPSQSSAIKQFLASLLSPPVLRYAVPALGVLVVMVVGIVVFRQQRKPDYIAQM